MFQHQAPVVFLGVCVCLLLCLTANNGERYDESVNQNFQQIPVDRVDLGLPDTTAYVGKIFEISFKNQPVFGDDDVKLKVTDVDKRNIPDWLNYNSSSHQLIGVATSHDLGEVYIHVRTVCVRESNDTCRSQSDVFKIIVKYGGPRNGQDSNSEPCEDETVLANLVLCVSPDSLHLSEKIHLILGMADFLSVPPSRLTLLPSSGQKLLAVEKGYQIISAGPGTGGICDLSRNIEMSWYLECATIKHMADFDKILQHNIKVGRIEKEIGQTIVGWYVASPNSLIHFQNRRRRQARYRTPVPTPVLSPIVPTRVVESQPEDRITLTSREDLSFTRNAGHSASHTSAFTQTYISTSSQTYGLPQIQITVASTKLADRSRPTSSSTQTVTITSTTTSQLPLVYSELPVWTKQTVYTTTQSQSYETDFQRPYTKETHPLVITSSWTPTKTKDRIASLLSTVSHDRTIRFESHDSLYHSASVLTIPPTESVPAIYPSMSHSYPYSTSATHTDETVGSGSGHDDAGDDDELDSPMSGMSKDVQGRLPGSEEEESTVLVRHTATFTDHIQIVPTKSSDMITETADSRLEQSVKSIPTQSAQKVTTQVLETTYSDITGIDYVYSVRTTLHHTTGLTSESSLYTSASTSEDQLLSPSVDTRSSDLIYSGSGSTANVAGDLESDKTWKVTSELAFSPVSSSAVVSRPLGADFFFEGDSDQIHFSRSITDSLMSRMMIDSSQPIEEVMESGSAELSGSGHALVDEEQGSGNVSGVLLPTQPTVILYPAQNSTPPLQGSSELVYTLMSSTPFILKETGPLSTSLSVSKLDSQNVSAILISPFVIPTPVVELETPRSPFIHTRDKSKTVTEELIIPHSTSGQFAKSSDTLFDRDVTSLQVPVSSGETATTERVFTTSPGESRSSTTRGRKNWKTTTGHTEGLVTFTTRPDMTWPPFTGKTSTTAVNNAPFLENPVDFISASLGKYFEFPVPRGVFYDIEDGDTRALKLSMTLQHGQTLPTDFWLQLDSKEQVITGLPLTVDLDTSHNMMVVLVAEDSGGLTAMDSIKLYVNPSSFTRFTHKFVMTFAVNFAEFMKKRNNLSFLLNKLSSYFGDSSAEHILVMDIEVGSLVLSWSNTTLNGNTCHTKSIGHIYHKLVRKDGKVRNSLNRHLGSKFRLKHVKYEPQGVCAEKITLPPVITTDGSDGLTTTTESSSESGMSIWAQVVLPVMIALLLLLLILLIILLINRKRKQRREKQKLEKPLFTNDRHPVIFPDELEGEHASLKPKKPIVLPNDTNRSLSSSPRTTYYFEDDSPSDNASNTGTGSRTGSGRRKPKSPPPYYQPHTDPPPYRLPPPYLTSNSSTV